MIFKLGEVMHGLRGEWSRQQGIGAEGRGMGGIVNVSGEWGGKGVFGSLTLPNQLHITKGGEYIGERG